MVMATNEKIAIPNAAPGNNGYHGTLKGRTRRGSFFLSCSSDTMDKIYNVNAPNTEMVIISDVLPVSNAIIPIAILTSNALDGV